MQTIDRLQLYGLVSAVALHGAVAALIAWGLATDVGAPTPGHSNLVVMKVHVLRSEARPEGSDAAPPAQARAALEPVEQSAPGPARIEPAAAREASTASSAPIGLAASGPASPAVEGEARTDYEQVLFAHLHNYFFYPNEALGRRLHGTVELHLELARNGQVLGAWVRTSSGEAALDSAALELVRRAEPLPAIPRPLPDRMDVDWPIEYLPPRILVGSRASGR